MIILTEGARPAKIQYNYEIAEEYSSFLLNTKIEEVYNPYIQMLEDEKSINVSYDNTSLTIMNQVNLFYYLGGPENLNRSRGIIENFTEQFVPEKYGFSYTIINQSDIMNTTTTIYNRTIDTDVNDAELVIASKKITFLQINSTTMFGPAIVEIKIWV